MVLKIIVPYLLSFLSSSGAAKVVSNETQFEILRKHLLLNYDRDARPGDLNSVTTCRLGLALTHVDVNEAKSTLIAYGMLRLIWKDNKLKWDPEDYGGLDILRLSPHEIWKPDIYLINSALAIPLRYSSSNMLAYSSGEILWVPPVTLPVLCDIDLRYWPFDTQTCQILFAHWTVNGSEIQFDIYNEDPTVDLDDLIDVKSQWKVVNTSLSVETKLSPCCEGNNPGMAVKLIVERNTPIYKHLIITPAFAIVSFILLAFWMSPFGNGRLFLNSFVALMICFFLLYFAKKLPTFGNHVPLIVSFYSSCLYLVCFSLIESAVVYWLARTPHSKPLPWIVKKQLTSELATFVRVGDNEHNDPVSSSARAEEIRDHQLLEGDPPFGIQEAAKDDSKQSHQQEWIMLGKTIDRIVFYLYCVIFVLLVITHSV